MKTVYMISKFLTLPGAYVRCFWEQLICRFLKLPVEPTGYIRADEACGHVEHSLAKKSFGAYMLATFPGFMNFNMGMSFFFLGFLNLKFMGITWYDTKVLFIIYIISMYIGISMLCALFPLTDDILNYWDLAYSSNKLKAKGIRRFFQVVRRVIVFPWAAITRFGAFLEKNCIIFILWIAAVVLMFIF